MAGLGAQGFSLLGQEKWSPCRPGPGKPSTQGKRPLRGLGKGVFPQAHSADPGRGSPSSGGSSGLSPGEEPLSLAGDKPRAQEP